MSELVPGAAAPAFTLPSDAGTDVSLADFAGRKVILYFYPKDNTSGAPLKPSSSATRSRASRPRATPSSASRAIP